MTAIFDIRSEVGQAQAESMDIQNMMSARAPKEAPGAFDGTLSAIPNAFGSLIGRAQRSIGGLGKEFAADHPEMVSKDTAEYFSETELRGQQNYFRYRADPVKHGAVSVAAQQLAEIGMEASVLAAGTSGFGALPMLARLGETGFSALRTGVMSTGVGGIEYSKIKSDLMEFDGLDERTASRVAAFQAASIGVGMALPFSLGLKALGDIGYNLAANVGIGMSERMAVSDELSRSGYNAMAENYRALGGVEILTDALFGAVLPSINKGAQAVSDYRMSKALADAATEIQKASHQQTQVIVTTPAGRQGVYDAMALADTQIMNGMAVDIGDAAKNVEFIVPTLESLEGDFKAVVEYAEADGAKYVDIEAVRQEVVTRSADAKAAASAEMAAKDAASNKEAELIEPTGQQRATVDASELLRIVEDSRGQPLAKDVEDIGLQKGDKPEDTKPIEIVVDANGKLDVGTDVARLVRAAERGESIEVVFDRGDAPKVSEALPFFPEKAGDPATPLSESSFQPKDVTQEKEKITKDSAESYSRVEKESHDEAVIRSYSAEADAKTIENAKRVFGDDKIMDEDGVMRTLDEIYAASDNLIEVSIKEGQMIEELAYCASVMGGVNG